MKILAGIIMLLGALACLMATIDLLEELPHLGRSLDYLPTVAQTAGVIGVGALLWLLSRDERSEDQ